MDNNALRAVLAVPGINFSLLTDTEKEIVISQFKELLDGLDFPLQFLIVSRFANTENYINVLRVKLGDETEPLIRLQLEDYIKFIREYTETHKVMKKIFYVVEDSKELIQLPLLSFDVSESQLKILESIEAIASFVKGLTDCRQIIGFRNILVHAGLVFGLRLKL